QHQDRVSEFLGTLQPNGLGKRRSLPELSEWRSVYSDSTRHTCSLAGRTEYESRGFRSGCVDHQAAADTHLRPAMGVRQRAGHRRTRTTWTLRQYSRVHRYSLADLENIFATTGRRL